MLPRLEIVLLLGGAARDGWDRAGIRRPGLYVPSGKIPHCSDRGLADPERRVTFEAAIADVADRLRQPPRQ
jgi:hypothetical protein